MKRVAKEMKICIKEGSFGGRSLTCIRGVPQEKVFSTEKAVQAFLAMNKEVKLTSTPSTHSVHGTRKHSGNYLFLVESGWTI